jgi:hypothetical protein
VANDKYRRFALVGSVDVLRSKSAATRRCSAAGVSNSRPTASAALRWRQRSGCTGVPLLSRSKWSNQNGIRAQKRNDLPSASIRPALVKAGLGSSFPSPIIGFFGESQCSLLGLAAGLSCHLEIALASMAYTLATIGRVCGALPELVCYAFCSRSTPQSTHLACSISVSLRMDSLCTWDSVDHLLLRVCLSSVVLLGPPNFRS